MSDDATTKLPEGEEKYDTKPGMTAVLERINELGATLEKQINDVAIEIRAEIMSLRDEMNKGFAILEKKMDVLGKDTLQVRAEQALLEDRVDKLERKPS
jgi:BMFP domain-containing protein YqiC